MDERKVKLYLGALLHDIGKVIYREGNDRRNHSISGHDYLTEIGIKDKEILDCVKYHHAKALSSARLDDNNLAYIVYIADNIAAFTDRRKKESEEETGFELSVPLQSVFNILNGNQQDYCYAPGSMNPEEGIKFPMKEKKSFEKRHYQNLIMGITENLKGMDWSEEYIESLLNVMEAQLTFVPSSTAKNELADISLYDHVKLTAALAACIYEYLDEKQLSYRESIFLKEQSFYREKAFLLCSMDVSGIQNFIYTITSKNALRTLRSRSFYLEIMMEHMIDVLLEKSGLSRANLLYSGGGHCYLIFPNTEKVKNQIEIFEREMKEWFLQMFQVELYIAMGFVECDANSFRNEPEGSYSELFSTLSRILAQKKQSRYNAADIIKLNSMQAEDYERECKVCKRIGHVNEEGLCELCVQIKQFSNNVLYSDFFTVIKGGANQGLPLPGGYSLVADEEASLRKRMDQDERFVRTYAKNRMYTGKYMTTKLWIGDYTTGDTFEAFAEKATGIDRIGVLRADVDNLGQAIVSGFQNEQNNNRYVTLSRTATLSRQLSMFFKYYIQMILENGICMVGDKKGNKKRNATIVYSGGDDVFLVGSWDDVVGLSIDLRNQFYRYTQGTLTLSAGIGIYESSYPIAVIAEETGDLESESKRREGKDSVTLFKDGEEHLENGIKTSDGTFSWTSLEHQVIGEKLRVIEQFFVDIDDRGMSFLYRMIELIRNQKDRINFARFVYLLARLEPTGNDMEKKRKYQEFSKNMYKWIQSEDDCRQLKVAMTIYAYMNRGKKEQSGNMSR